MALLAQKTFFDAQNQPVAMLQFKDLDIGEYEFHIHNMADEYAVGTIKYAVPYGQYNRDPLEELWQGFIDGVAQSLRDDNAPFGPILETVVGECCSQVEHYQVSRSFTNRHWLTPEKDMPLNLG